MAVEPPSIRALDFQIPGFFVSTGLAAPTTCLNYYVSSICNDLPLSTNFSESNLPLSTNFSESNLPLSTRKTFTIHGLLWKTGADAQNRTL